MMDRNAQEKAVTEICEAIGYGRTMQLCEQLWRKKLEEDKTGYYGPPGSEHSTGPCVAFLVPCECREIGGSTNCDWCCGAGRVTERVRGAQLAQ